MSEITLTIGGHAYRLGCEDDETERLQALGVELDRSIAALKTRLGPVGDRRLLVMAALSALDRLDGVEQSLAALKSEVGTLERARQSAALAAGEEDEALIARINAATETVEAVARTLTSAMTAPRPPADDTAEPS